MNAKTEYRYLTMTACIVCRKKVDLDNRVESGHAKLDDGCKVTAARHFECNEDRSKLTFRKGCLGRWEPWMGIAVGRSK